MLMSVTTIKSRTASVFSDQQICDVASNDAASIAPCIPYHFFKASGVGIRGSISARVAAL